MYIPLSLTALLLLRDWIFAEFNIFGGNLLIETFEGATETHWGFGILLLIIGLAHVLMHVGQEKKPILPKDVGADLRATVQSLKYVTFLSSWDEKGAAHKYKGNQRLTYVITFYVIALAALTGFMALAGLWGEVSTWLHVVSGVMVLLLSTFRIVYLLRKREWIAWRALLRTGRVPEWYVRKNHPRWYEELRPERVPEAEGEAPERGPEQEPAESTAEAG